MNREMLHRLKTAGEYQKKAIMALLPKQIIPEQILSGKVKKHLDIIEKEIKVMAAETVAQMVLEYIKNDIPNERQDGEWGYERQDCGKADERQDQDIKTAHVKKVEIS